MAKIAAEGENRKLKMIADTVHRNHFKLRIKVPKKKNHDFYFTYY